MNEELIAFLKEITLHGEVPHSLRQKALELLLSQSAAGMTVTPTVHILKYPNGERITTISMKEYAALLPLVKDSATKLAAIKKLRMIAVIALREAKEAVENEANWTTPIELPYNPR
jgi:ribosomal protein L7/L12